MTEHLTESQHLEQRITQALVTIRREWPAMMPKGPAGSRPGGGAKSTLITADDDDDTGHDIDRHTRLVSLRRHIAGELARWCKTVIEDANVTTPPIKCDGLGPERVTLRWPERGPLAKDQLTIVDRCGRNTPLIDGHLHWLDGTNVPDMCTFLERWARWLSGHRDAEDAADRIAGCTPDCEARDLVASHSCAGLVHAVRKHTPPPIVERARKPRPRHIGTCPLLWEAETDDGRLEMRECGGDVRAFPTPFTDPTREEQIKQPLPTCDRCGTAADVAWWYREMYGNHGLSHLVTVDELITVIAVRLDYVATRDQVRQWKHRGKIAGVDKDSKGRTLYRHDDVIDAIHDDVEKIKAKRKVEA